MLPALFSPNFRRRLELLKIRTRRSFLGGRQGGHISPKRGHGIEFSDYRKYELGDNPRHIDWGVYGRTDRLYVKRFQEEQDLNVVILLDISHSLAAIPEDRKWQLAIETALSLAYVALMDQDSVLLGAIGGPLSPKYSGGRSMGRIAAFLESLTPNRVTEPGAELGRMLAQVRFPGVTVVLSDFLFPLEQIERMCTAILSKNFDASFIHILGAQDLAPFPGMEGAFARDSETDREMFLGLSRSERQRYDEALSAHNSEVKALCGRCGIQYVEAFSISKHEQFILEELPRVGVFR